MKKLLTTIFWIFVIINQQSAAQASEQPSAYTPTLVTDKTTDALRQELAVILKESARWVRYAYKGHDMVIHERIDSVLTEGDEIVVEFGNAKVTGTGTDNRIFHYRVTYVDLTEMKFDGTTCTTDSVILPSKMTVLFNRPIAHRLCDVLFTLSYPSREKLAETETLFDELAARYRAMPTKPPVTEEMRRLIVQAEILRERKDYPGAAERYRKAVALDPVVYPAAYFNLALLYEQQKLYSRAIAAMRKYLLLQPNAPDARAAQDKIYGWELFAGEAK